MTYRNQEQVGEEIATLRAERGVSQRRLAQAVGLDASALSRIESGERGLAVGELVAVAEYLGAEVDRLLLDEADAPPLFRGDGDPERGNAAVAAFGEIIDDFFTFEAAVRS